MQFILGMIFGVLISVLIVSVLAYFRRVIEHQVNIVEKQIDIVAPRPKGMVIIPEDDATISRNEIVEENHRQGKDIKLEDLL